MLQALRAVCLENRLQFMYSVTWLMYLCQWADNESQLVENYIKILSLNVLVQLLIEYAYDYKPN